MRGDCEQVLELFPSSPPSPSIMLLTEENRLDSIAVSISRIHSLLPMGFDPADE